MTSHAPVSQGPTSQGPGSHGPVDFDSYLEESLFQRRIVVAHGVLDDDLATRTAARLLTLEALAAEPIQLRLSCPGGELGAALSLVDTLGVVGVPLTAVAVGEVGGAAVAVLAAAPDRVGYPHARFQLRDPRAAEVSGSASELESHAREHLRMRAAFVDLIADATGRQAEAVSDDLRRGRFLSAVEAVGYGLLTRLAGPEARTPTVG